MLLAGLVLDWCWLGCGLVVLAWWWWWAGGGISIEHFVNLRLINSDTAAAVTGPSTAGLLVFITARSSTSQPLDWEAAQRRPAGL